jgi:hypothetical protein
LIIWLFELFDNFQPAGAQVGSFLKVFSIKLLLVKGRFEKGVTYENNG